MVYWCGCGGVAAGGCGGGVAGRRGGSGESKEASGAAEMGLWGRSCDLCFFIFSEMFDVLIPFKIVCRLF